MTELLVQDVKKHYRLLNHRGLHSQVHAQDKQAGKLRDRKLLYGESELLEWVSRHNGKADLYIGRNPRTKDGRVADIRTLSLDIDPVRPKDNASTEEQLQEAITAGRYIHELPEYSQSTLASSGNGCHIYWRLNPAWKVTEYQIQQFETSVRKLVEEKFNVKVDAIYDSPRLVKIIGTKATKGELSLQRVSRFLCPINWGRPFDQRILERLRSYPETQQDGGITLISKERVTDRSAADFKLAVQLLKGGSSYEDTCTYLKNRGYKAPEREDNYTINTVRRAQASIHDSRNGIRRYDEGPSEERKPIEIFTPASHFEEFERFIEEGADHKIELATGFSTLDGYTGGLKKGGIWVVGARTNVGKTSFSVTVANNLLRRGKRVLIFSTETDWLNTFARFASIGTGIKLHNLTDHPELLTGTDKERLKEYEGTFKSQALHIIQEPEPDLRVVAEEVARIRPDVFIFDHIQRVANQGEQRHRELAKFIKGLNNICREHHCAGIVNSQLNRLAETEVPSLSHLRECGALEEEAHAVVLLSGVSNSPGCDALILGDLAKNRGPKGTVELKLNRVTAEFKEIGNESLAKDK